MTKKSSVLDCIAREGLGERELTLTKPHTQAVNDNCAVSLAALLAVAPYVSMIFMI